MDFFTFDQQMVPVRKVNYFAEASAAIEQKLLIQYGEMVQRQYLGALKQPLDYVKAAQSIRTAGLLHLIRHELDLASERLNHRPQRIRLNSQKADTGPRVPALLDQLRAAAATLNSPGDVKAVHVLFTGAVDADTPAFFTSFPYTLDALLQVAELDLSFFSVRFVISRLFNDTNRNLFACVVKDRIAGLVYLRRKKAMLYQGLEIKYIASCKDATAVGSVPALPRYRGVGTFLVAGVWLLWKNGPAGVHEIVLDAEHRATGFYEAIGFKSRRPFVFALSRPAGYLLNALAVMIDRSSDIQTRVIREFAGLIRMQVRLLAASRPGTARHEQALGFIKLCLLSRSQPLLARTAAELLLQYRQRISASEHLLQWAAFHGRIRLVDSPAPSVHPVLILKHDAMHLHLQGIFHVENAKRLKAIDDVLGDANLTGRWTPVTARIAATEELAWIHHPEHIARIAATAGKTLTSIDLDTQTTANSYHSARLAVGGVFNLLDAVMSGPARRGFAAVRPPGHHAEPDKAMGFCLFNNAALGACYLKHAKGLKKVMIVDIDAHHGNGTQKAFYHTDEVLYVSMHQFPCYPGSGNFAEIGQGAGEGYSVNVPLEKGMGDREFVQVIDRLVDPLACAYEPEAIIVSCGFDLYHGDSLVDLKGTAEGYAMMTRMLCRIADLVCDGRIAFVMEGGYSIQGIRECGLKVIQELSEMPAFEASRLDKILNGSSSVFTSLKKTIAIHEKHWSILNR